MIPDCNLARQDIICTEDIFGTNLGSIKGKTTRWPAEHVCICISWENAPKEILERRGNVTLTVDIMVINKIPFMITTSRNIHFGTAELIWDKTKTPL